MAGREGSIQLEIARYLLAIRAVMECAVRLCVLWVCLSVGRLAASFSQALKRLAGPLLVIGRQRIGLGWAGLAWTMPATGVSL